MHSTDARADHITAGLAGLGLRPRCTDHHDHVRIETEVPEPALADSWRDFLALLEAADRFGLCSSAEYGLIAWAIVRKVAPAAGEAARRRGQCHQLYGS